MHHNISIQSSAACGRTVVSLLLCLGGVALFYQSSYISQYTVGIISPHSISQMTHDVAAKALRTSTDNHSVSTAPVCWLHVQQQPVTVVGGTSILPRRLVAVQHNVTGVTPTALRFVPVFTGKPDTCDTGAQADSKPQLVQFKQSSDGVNVVAIVMAITSKKLFGGEKASKETIANFPLIKTMLPSFCKTASRGNYIYRFYLAFDENDRFFANRTYTEMFDTMFIDVMQRLCRDLTTQLIMLQCPYTGKPAWAQNDAAMEAYLDGSHYIYRVNDDMNMISNNWTSRFIEKLKTFSPSNVGIVAPSGGRKDIFTFEFVHKTHIDIFGFYYPREFPDWFCDGWITKVYSPSRTFRFKDIKVIHTESTGQRYSSSGRLNYLKPQVIQREKIHLNRYVRQTIQRNKTEVLRTEPTQCGIISVTSSKAAHSELPLIATNAQRFRSYSLNCTSILIVHNATCDDTQHTQHIDPRLLAKIQQFGTRVYLFENYVDVFNIETVYNVLNISVPLFVWPRDQIIDKDTVILINRYFNKEHLNSRQ